MRRLHFTFILVAIVSACFVGVARNAASPTIPLCPGLTIVTAVSQQDGDYESIKTVQSVTDSDVRLKYSVERLVEDWLSSGPPKLLKYTLDRTVRRSDLDSAILYEQQFSTELPEMVPETTAIGTSAAVLNALKTKGEAKLGIFIAYSQTKPSLDRNTHPNVYDNQMVATITRVGNAPVMLQVIVNDVRVELPSIQARGDFFGDKSEFFFLDDEKNPLALAFRIGIDFIKPLDPAQIEQCAAARKSGSNAFPLRCDLPNGAARDALRVIKITFRCGAPAATPAGNLNADTGAGQPSGGQPAGGASTLEKSLSDTGKADVYSIYFSFNSDVIREESEPTLKEIAELLRRHGDWKLQVNGHTDGIGTNQYNLELSKRRAVAVREALVKRYGIDAGRLTSQGFGKSQPKDTNDTLEGRARNRRVELVRQQ